MTEVRQGTCVVCQKGFHYRLRGKPQTTCSPECRTIHRQQLAVERMGRWALRRTAVGPLGYPSRLGCRFAVLLTDNASQTGTCDEAAAVLYIGDGATSYALCFAHESHEAHEAALAEGLQRISLLVEVRA